MFIPNKTGLNIKPFVCNDFPYLVASLCYEDDRFLLQIIQDVIVEIILLQKTDI